MQGVSVNAGSRLFVGEPICTANWGEPRAHTVTAHLWDRGCYGPTGGYDMQCLLLCLNLRFGDLQACLAMRGLAHIADCPATSKADSLRGAIGQTSSLCVDSHSA